MLTAKKIKKTETPSNLQTMKQANLSLLFGLVHRHGSVSRAELANITGLSPTTVSSLVDEMLERGLLLQTGAGTSETSGRKPIMLEVNPQGGYVAGIELLDGGLNLELFDLLGNSVLFQSSPVRDYSNIGDTIIQNLDELLSRLKVSDEKMAGLCIGVPGIIDTAAGRVIQSTVITIDPENDFFDRLQDRFAASSVVMGNESHFCAYFEKSSMGENVKSLIFIDIDIGIGAGIILDNQIFEGAYGNSGEFGHISIDINGPVCKCGKRGCLETLASAPAIVRRASDAAGRELSFDELAELFRRKDRVILPVLEDAANKLAYGINNVINMLNPEAVIIGGKITALGEGFLELVRARLYGISLAPGVNRVILKYSQAAGNPVTKGCARFMLDRIFYGDEFFAG